MQLTSRTKILLAVFTIIGGCLVLRFILYMISGVILPMVIARGTKSELINDPVEMNELGQDIVNYDLPPDFSEITMVYFPSTESKTLLLAPQNNKILIYLVQYPQAFSPAMFPPSHIINAQVRQEQEQFNLALLNDLLAMPIMATEEIVINGQQATLTTREGIVNDVEARIVTSDFLAKNGAEAWLMITSSTQYWDDFAITQFVESLE